jgi:hypothetical protein
MDSDQIGLMACHNWVAQALLGPLEAQNWLKISDFSQILRLDILTR